MAGNRVLDQEYPDVAATGAPGGDYQHIETSPAMFGGAIAGAEEKLGQAGEQTSNTAFQLSDFYGKITADQRTNEFNDRQMKRFYGDPNDPSQPGLFSLKGAAAMTAWPQVMAANEADRQSLGSDLSPAARFQFEGDTRRSALMMSQAAGRHVDEQFNTYAATTSNAKADNALRLIGTQYNDDNAYKQALSDGANAVGSMARLNGVDPNTADGKAILENQLAEFHAKAITARVEGMQNASASQARAFLEANKGELDSKTYDALVTRLRPMQASDIGSEAVTNAPKNTPSPPTTFTPAFFSERAPGKNADLDPSFGSGLQAAVTAAEAATGQKAAFTSLRRTTAQQAALYANYQAGGGLAAPPGLSLHEQGKAADLAPGPILDWLHQNASAHPEWGVEFLKGRAGAMDPGHIQASGHQGAGVAPGAAASSGEFAPGSFDSALGRTLKEEGTGLVTDANGASVKMGINAAAHPGEDIAGMTKERATQIYKSQYWDPIGGDDLAKTNPSLAHVAFDAAVTSGVSTAKNWLSESGGDVGKFMSLYEGHFAGLIARDPAKYGRYLNAWQQRIKDLASDAGLASRPSTISPYNVDTDSTEPFQPAAALPIQQTSLTAPVEPAASPDDTYGMPDRDAALRTAKAAAGDDPILQKMAMADVNRRYSEMMSLTYAQRYQLEQKIPDIMAAASSGANVQLPEADIKQAFPRPKADAIIQKFATAQAVGQVMKGTEFASPAELAKIQGDLTSGMGVLSDIIHPRRGAASTGPGSLTPSGIEDTPDEFTVRRAAATKVQQEIDKRNEILYGPNADPAAYAALHPAAQAALAAVDPKNPATFENYASTSLALQKYLGVPDALQHVLTRGQAMNLAGQIEKSDDPKSSFENLQQQFGAAWPHVFHDAITLGKLAPGYQAVAALDDPHDAALLSSTIAREKPNPDGKPSTSLDDVVGTIARSKTEPGQIRDGVRNDTDTTAYVSSIRQSGASDEQIEGIINSVQTLALAKRANGEATSAGAATSAAVKSFFGKFNYMPNGGARVPSDKFDTVSSNAQTSLSKLSSNDVAVPSVFGQEGQPDKDEYVSTLKAAPTWITSPKGDSLWLLDQGGRMVRTNDGKPFEIKFDTPRAQAITAAPPSATNFTPPTATNATPSPQNYQQPPVKSAPGFGMSP